MLRVSVYLWNGSDFYMCIICLLAVVTRAVLGSESEVKEGAACRAWMSHAVATVSLTSSLSVF